MGLRLTITAGPNLSGTVALHSLAAFNFRFSAFPASRHTTPCSFFPARVVLEPPAAIMELPWSVSTAELLASRMTHAKNSRDWK